MSSGRQLPWVGVVSEDGSRIYFDHAREWKAHLADFAGTEVELVIRPRRRPITEEQRGLWWGQLVRAFAEFAGVETMQEAHRLLLEIVDWVPGEPLPSTANGRSDRVEMTDRILRASAFLASCGVVLDTPEPDPVRRMEAAAKERAA